MRPFSACLLLVAASAQAANLPGSTEQIAKWESFKALHNKAHAAHEEHPRFQRFIEADAEIQAHNVRFAQGLESFEKRHTQYTDLTNEEFSKYALGFIPAMNASDIPHAPLMPTGYYPASFDWRHQNRMTPMRNQLYCGSCYAFAGAGVVESYLKGKYNGYDFDTSEQEVVDCSYKKFGYHNGGCSGGWPTAVFDHYKARDIAMEHEYPYVSGNSGTHHQCSQPNVKYNYVKSTMKVVHVTPRTEDELAEVLYTKGPLTIAMVADNEHKRNFQDLGDGVFDMEHTIKIQPNHAVVLVGYGYDNKVNKPFWVIKNSWGTEWGVGGYGKIYRGKNMCNIMMYGVWYVE